MSSNLYRKFRTLRQDLFSWHPVTTTQNLSWKKLHWLPISECVQYDKIQLYCLCVETFAFWLVIYIKTFNKINNKTPTIYIKTFNKINNKTSTIYIKTFNKINNKTSTICIKTSTTQWNTELETAQIQGKYLTITIFSWSIKSLVCVSVL